MTHRIISKDVADCITVGISYTVGESVLRHIDGKNISNGYSVNLHPLFSARPITGHTRQCLWAEKLYSRSRPYWRARVFQVREASVIFRLNWMLNPNSICVAACWCIHACVCHALQQANSSWRSYRGSGRHDNRYQRERISHCGKGI